MEFDFADIKPSILNVVMILLIVMVTVPLAKYVFNEVMPVPGVTDLVNAI